MKVLVATNNTGKLQEIREILDGTGIEVISLSDVDSTGEPVEDADTFEENAIKKATFYARQTNLPTIADDSGLCVDALNGAPGIHSARFSGTDANDDKNNALLLNKMRQVPDAERTAHFACSMVCVWPDGNILTSSGRCDGVILREKKGNEGFGYDPLFFVPDLEKTFAQLEPKQKNSISHRGRALRKLAAQLPAFLSS